MAKMVVGEGDQSAKARALFSDSIGKGADAAIEGGAVSMFVAKELDADTPLAVTLTVYAPEELRMSPAIGESPEAVLGVLRQGFGSVDLDGFDTLQEMDLNGFKALRTHTIKVEDLDDDDLEGISTHNMTVNYWCTVPDTKKIALVNFVTPMGTIKHTMLTLFDAILEAAYFEAPESIHGPDNTREDAGATL